MRRSNGGYFAYAFHKQGEPQYDKSKPDLFVVGSVWQGRTEETKPQGERRQIDLVITARNGKTFRADVRAGKGVLRVVEGTVEKGVIKWQDKPIKGERSVRGHPTTGEINGTRIEALFSGLGVTSKPVEGFVALEYLPPDKK